MDTTPTIYPAFRLVAQFADGQRLYFDGLTEQQAQQRMETLIVQLKSTEGITETLKAADPISWTQRMNSIAARAEEIIREELIYNG